MNFKFLGCNGNNEVETWRRRKRNLGYWLLYDFFTSEGSKLLVFCCQGSGFPDKTSAADEDQVPGGYKAIMVLRVTDGLVIAEEAPHCQFRRESLAKPGQGPKQTGYQQVGCPASPRFLT